MICVIEMLVGDSCTCIIVVENFVTLHASLLLLMRHGKRYLFDYLLIYWFTIAMYYCIFIDDDND